MTNNAKHLTVNISDIHGCFVWMLNKTASSHSVSVFSQFEFKNYKYDGSFLTLINNSFRHNHDCFLFDGHEKYKLIATARNPYSRMVSSYKSFNDNIHKKNTGNIIEDFNEYLFDYYYTNSASFKNIEKNCADLSKRIPDYFVRTEFMIEDYLKIPFIKNSELNESGKLEKICNTKVTESTLKTDWKDFYTQSSADMVYYNTSKYFDILGYDKNSWKK